MDNLGNSCYMNSSYNLGNTDLLTDYFLTDSYLRDNIKDSNKHGYKGRVARSFGKLAIDLWGSNRSCISSKKFYYELAALREQFAGNDQHDVPLLFAFAYHLLFCWSNGSCMCIMHMSCWAFFWMGCRKI
jgi:ubiquitin C-terminal hydrolase